MKIKHTIIEKRHYVNLEFEKTEDFDRLSLVEVCKMTKKSGEEEKYHGTLFKVMINYEDFYFFLGRRC